MKKPGVKPGFFVRQYDNCKSYICNILALQLG